MVFRLLLVSEYRTAACTGETADHEAFFATEHTADQHSDTGSNADVKCFAVTTINIRPLICIIAVAVTVVVVTRVIVVAVVIIAPLIRVAVALCLCGCRKRGHARRNH